MESPFAASRYLEEFEAFLPKVSVSERCPLNTEMFFLWGMIRTMKPTLFIESGTYRGYSATFICEALRRNENGAEFVSFGFNTQDCLPDARRSLGRYPSARVVEGDSREHLSSWPYETRLTAFFIDGPKGRNLPPLLYSIEKRFANKLFVAVHDCEPENGSYNRWYLETFWGSAHPIIYCDSTFQESYSHLDDAILNAPEQSHWRPYHLHGKRRTSYGTQTGFVLFDCDPVGTPSSRLKGRVSRFLRFRVVQASAKRIRMFWRSS